MVFTIVCVLPPPLKILSLHQKITTYYFYHLEELPDCAGSLSQVWIDQSVTGIIEVFYSDMQS